MFLKNIITITCGCKGLLCVRKFGEVNVIRGYYFKKSSGYDGQTARFGLDHGLDYCDLLWLLAG